MLNTTLIKLSIDCITNLKYNFNKTGLEYNSCTWHPNYYKKIFFFYSIKMLNPSLKDLNPASEELKKPNYLQKKRY